MYGYIYKTTNLINSRSYVGQKKAQSFCSTYYGSGTLLETALQKYGKDNFQIEILCWANTKEELDCLEIEYIKKYSSEEKLYKTEKVHNNYDLNKTKYLKNVYEQIPRMNIPIVYESKILPSHEFVEKSLAHK